MKRQFSVNYQSGPYLEKRTPLLSNKDNFRCVRPVTAAIQGKTPQSKNKHPTNPNCHYGLH